MEGQQKVYDAFFGVPASVAPSTPVRYWNQAIPLALIVFIAVYVGITYALRFNDPYLPMSFEIMMGMKALIYAASFKALFVEDGMRYWELMHSSRVGWFDVIRPFIALITSMLVSTPLFFKLIVPRTNTSIIGGQLYKVGKDAIKEAQYWTKRLNFGRRKFMCLHDELWLPAKMWFRHIIMIGSSGAGKTTILIRVIIQIITNNFKLFLYDSKGDFVSYENFGVKGRVRPLLLCVDHAESYFHDLGADINTGPELEQFALRVIPDVEGANSFFPKAARMILVGCGRDLIAKHGKNWSYAELYRASNKTIPEMAEMLLTKYKQAHANLANEEGTTAQSVINTLYSLLQPIQYIAMAWPKRVPNRMFSMKEFCKDNYKGRRQVVYQRCSMEVMNEFLLGLLVNILVDTVVSPQMKESSKRNFFVVIDELASCGKINGLITALEQARSKGVALILFMQSQLQLERIYGKENASMIGSMVGTRIFGQMQMGEDRTRVAQMFGTNLMSKLDHSKDAKAHEEGRSVIYEAQLTTDLGPEEWVEKGVPKWSVKAMVVTGKSNIMNLEFPGIPMEQTRKFKAAKWLSVGADQVEAMINKHAPEPVKQLELKKQEAIPEATEVPEQEPKQSGAIIMNEDDLRQFFDF